MPFLYVLPINKLSYVCVPHFWPIRKKHIPRTTAVTKPTNLQVCPGGVFLESELISRPQSSVPRGNGSSALEDEFFGESQAEAPPSLPRHPLSNLKHFPQPELATAATALVRILPQHLQEKPARAGILSLPLTAGLKTTPRDKLVLENKM